MRLAALLAGGLAVDRRPRERVAELDPPGAERDQSGSLGRGEVLEAEAQ